MFGHSNSGRERIKPPISTIDYRPGNIGSTVLLDPDLSPQFWKDIQAGTLAPGVVGGIPK